MKTHKNFFLSISLVFFLSACSGNKQADENTKAVHSESLAKNPTIELHKKIVRTGPDLAPHLDSLQMADKKIGLGGAIPTAASAMKMQAFTNSPPQWNRESYNSWDDNDFVNCANDSLSTFSIDVDTASYSNVRRIVNQGSLPPVGAVRIEEMINYFNYNYPQPKRNEPIAVITETGPSPFNQEFSLLKIGIKAKAIDTTQLPPSNLVFLVDVSGSMNSPNKLPLLKKAMKLVVARMGKHDRISIITYAGADGVALNPTNGSNKNEIFAAIETMRSAGSTNASAGIHTAYTFAEQVFIPGGNNRIILASDGDFNVGTTSRGELQKLVEEKRNTGVYLTVLGFGSGNYHDDTMEVLADKGNGNYAYIDSLLEAKKVLVKEIGGTIFTVANDVKIQVEFNPILVGAYRLIGYENRSLADEAFTNDTKDAGEIGAGQTVTAMYEIMPAGHSHIPHVDSLKYQKFMQHSRNDNTEIATVKVRYKKGREPASRLISHNVIDTGRSFPEMSEDFRFAAAVAGYGMLLRKSEHVGVFTLRDCLIIAQKSKGEDKEGYRAEFLRLVEMTELMQF